MDIIVSRERPTFNTTIKFADKTEVTVECNEWPEVRDGWVILATLDDYKMKAKKRYYYHEDDVVGLTSVLIDSQ